MQLKKVQVSGQDYDGLPAEQVFEYLLSTLYPLERIETTWSTRDSRGTIWAEISGVVCWFEIEFTDLAEFRLWQTIFPIAFVDETQATVTYRKIRDFLQLDSK